MNALRKSLKYVLPALLLGVLSTACNDDEKGGNPIDNQPLLPKHELRGVWMATVWGLDWPMGNYGVEAQKKLYTDYLDHFVQLGINAVFFQVRGMGDAFYDSPYESWSSNITGTAGKDPGYDILNFLINEAHKRGIQFHAWMNPYRIATRSAATASFPALSSKIPAEWTKDYNKIRIYNPALPEVQQRITDIVKDLITKYPVDGIHMDDYFYPELDSGENMNDADEYALYGSEYASVEAFRRANVDKTVQAIQQTVISTRPEVVFSVSPTSNQDYNYGTLFADVPTWSQNGWVDLIIPQLYQASGSPSDASCFNSRLYWWSQFTYLNHLMVGYGYYRFGDTTAGEKFQSADELRTQFNFAATLRKVQGSLLYSAHYLTDNRIGITDVLAEIYSHRVLPPYLGRTPAETIAAPSSVSISGGTLSWSAVSGSSQYAVYQSNGNGQVATLIGTTESTGYTLPAKGSYFVTALLANYAESEPSGVVAY
jgi:uncharacterized lipoprotein YddW (UPF0748 family)